MTDMLEILLRQKKSMVEYLLLKVEQEDWHGIADAAMDIREIVAKISMLEDIKKASPK